MSFSAEQIAAALDHLCSANPIMGKVIQQVGPFTLKLERNRFRMLVRSIVSQQISTKAARAIRCRLEELLAPCRITAQNIANQSVDELRSIGLSAQKANYLSDKVLTGVLHLRSIGHMSDKM